MLLFFMSFYGSFRVTQHRPLTSLKTLYSEPLCSNTSRMSLDTFLLDGKWIVPFNISIARCTSDVFKYRRYFGKVKGINRLAFPGFHRTHVCQYRESLLLSISTITFLRSVVYNENILANH